MTHVVSDGLSMVHTAGQKMRDGVSTAAHGVREGVNGIRHGESSTGHKQARWIGKARMIELAGSAAGMLAAFITSKLVRALVNRKRG